MEKSFNDKELSDIMQEIEALEDGFGDIEEQTASSVLEELAAMDELDSVPAKTAKVIPFGSKTAPAPVQKNNHETSMSFKVHGEMNVNLQFDIGGKTVSLNVNEEGLTIVMDGGMTFSVPVVEKTLNKKSA